MAARLRAKERNSDGKLRSFIIQKYIENPLLYQRRKFDLRHFMLVTCINGCFKAYWYEEGYVRTSSNEFSLRDCRDPMIHLTNDAVQKNNESYGRYEKGNKLSYGELQKYMETRLKYGRDCLAGQILPEMKRIAADAVRATYSLLDDSRRMHNF